MAIEPQDWSRAREVFEGALALPASDRGAHVAAACGGNDTLRALIEGMLDSHGRAPRFLETPAAALVDETIDERSLEGLRIGPYRLQSRIGEGGMGEVYRARDTRLDRTVALKLLPAHVANDPQARERFDREGRAIAALNHPHICALYDVGEAAVTDGESSDPDHQPLIVRFLVMELLEGETLAARLARGPLPMDEALQYAVQIASALERAHQLGIVHRDLKPGNIFLVPGGGPSSTRTAKLLDFGLAKKGAPLAESDPTGIRIAADLTTPGTILGTLQYMAPEQIEGKDTDARTDIFAFGQVLFEMLTGRKAFEADSQASLMVAILDREPLRLSSLQPLAPPWLEPVIGRCLAKNPDQRWPSARDVMLELQSPHDQPAPLSASTPAHPQINRLRRRRSVAIACAIGVVVAITVALLTAPARRWLIASAPAPASPAVQPAALAVMPFRSIDSPEAEAAHLGVGIADAIVTKLANLQAIRVRPTSAILSFEGRAIDAVTVGRQLQVEHVLTGTVRRAEDAYRFNLQLIRASDGALVWGRQIDVSRGGLFGVEDQVTADVVSALQLQISSSERTRLHRRTTQDPGAYDEYLQGRALMANYSESNLRQAMSHFERALTIDSTFVLAEAGLAMAAGTFSVRFAYEPQASEWGRRAEEHAQRALQQDATLAEAHLALASAAGTLYRNFDWSTAIAESKAALSLNPNLDLAHSAMARAFYHVGLLDWSELELRRAEETSGVTNVDLEVGRVRLYHRLLSGHFDEAQTMAETLARRTDAPAIRQYLGLAMFYRGDGAGAENLLALVRRPDGSPDTRSQASLAGVLAANGRRDEAARAVRTVLDSGYMDHHVAYALGAFEAQRGRAVDAVKWLRSAADTGFPCYEWVTRDPLLKPIRSHAAFQTFLATLRADYDRTRARYEAVSRQPPD